MNSVVKLPRWSHGVVDSVLALFDAISAMPYLYGGFLAGSENPLTAVDNTAIVG